MAHSAVEEIVRIASPVTYMRRTALCDTEMRSDVGSNSEATIVNRWSAQAMSGSGPPKCSANGSSRRVSPSPESRWSCSSSPRLRSFAQDP